ncbi:MAG: hypothetical protein Q9225_003257 [Loekoesia sp. 1 TL-2023]
MPVSTRHKAALRRAEGLPPSPQNEDDLPRELRGPQRRQRKAARPNRWAVTPESEEDIASKQDQGATAQALREGNAGGYVMHNTSEQQDSLPELQPLSPDSQPEQDIGTHEHHDSQEGTPSSGILPTSVPVETVHTPPHSPTFSTLSTPQLLSTFNFLSNKEVAQRGVRNMQPLEEQAAGAKSVSTQVDGQFAAMRPSITARTSPKNLRSLMRTTSAQTDAPVDRFRPLGLDDFRSELAVPPESCSVILHLDADREIRISKVSSAAVDEIKNILQNHQFVYERNWLTSEEAAAELAVEAEKHPQSSNKRKRDDATDDTTRNAQRRRIEATSTPTPTARSTPGPFRLRSRLRMKAGSSSQSQAARSPLRRDLSPANPSTATNTMVNYGQDGSLQLLGSTSEIRQQNGSKGGKSVPEVAATSNDSDDEGESEGILLFPNLASANRAMFGDSLGQETNTSTQALVIASEPPTSDTQGNQSGATDQTPGDRPTVPEVETPQTSGWGFGSLFNTARRFIPGMRRQRAPFAAPRTNQPVVRDQQILDSHNSDMSQRGVQTEPRRQDQLSDTGTMDSVSNFAQRLRDSQSATQKTFRTKENIEEIKKMKTEKERLKAEWAKLEEERRITEQERKDVEDAHRAAYASQRPGSKRRLRPSPRVIPNPKGVSYGLDPTYFDSSDEDEEPSPSRTHPRKARRFHGPDRSQTRKDDGPKDENTRLIEGFHPPSGTQALQYRGSRFSDSPPNVFSLSTARSDNKKRAAKDANPTGRRLDDPGFNRMGHFQVPLSPSSSEEDETEDQTEEATGEAPAKTPTVEKSVSPPSEKDTSGGQASDNSAAAASPIIATPAPSQLPTTPAPKQEARAVRFTKDNDPSKTLEQSRQNLRAQLLKKGGKSVLSPKDIPSSPIKTQTSSQASRAPIPNSGATGNSSNTQQKDSSNLRASDEESLFIQSSKERSLENSAGLGASPDTREVRRSTVQPAPGDEYSIRGAASRGSPKSPQRLLAETLPSIHGSISKLHAYEDFQQDLDPAIREFLESSWEARDDEASANGFQSTFTAHHAPEQQEVQLQATPTVPKTVNVGPFVDDLEDYEDDDASLYGKDVEAGNEVHGSTGQALNAMQPNTVGNQNLDPGVAAFLNSEWTPDDEAYASDEFKENFTSRKIPGNSTEHSSPSLNVAA